MRGTTMQIHRFRVVDKAMLITQSPVDVFTPEDFADTTVGAERRVSRAAPWRAFWALPRKTVAFNLAFPPVVADGRHYRSKGRRWATTDLLVPWSRSLTS